ncbi:MAG: tetratricopeptide repeat protein, partial [Treponema sp.]|nr:tetratricopeptide repeat protein [Treponema sp.]
GPRIVRIFMDYTGSGELKSVLIHVIRGPYLVIFKGNNYTIKGDYDRASAEFTKALRINPNNAFVYNNRGIPIRKKGTI